MAWYYGTFACGHEGRVNIIGPLKDREWKKEREFSKLCEDCYKKSRELEKEVAKKEAIEKAKEMELPELQGTEKQVAWAVTIRQKMIDAYEETIQDEKELRRFERFEKVNREKLAKVFDFILAQDTARFFINNRYETLRTIIAAYKDEALDEPGFETDEEVEAKIEAIVEPVEKISDCIAEIRIGKGHISVSFERNEKFRKVVKNLGFEWNGDAWKKSINEYTGSAEERAAELGNKLLNAGFRIRIFDEEVRKNAIDGNFKPECRRWIKRVIGKEKFTIGWAGYNDELYQKARSLPGARWSSELKAMIVDAAHIEAIEDFADNYGFKFSQKAEELAEEYKKRSILTVDPARVEDNESRRLDDILKQGSDVIADLRD